MAVRSFKSERVRRPPGAPEFIRPPAGVPLDVEIGCGAGLHPIRYGQAHPERMLVAIEHTKTRFDLFSGRLKNHPEIKNVQAVHADAVAWITHFLPNESVDRFFLLYPNPFPKAKRWPALPFFAQLVTALKPGGTVLLATNIEDYARDAARWFAEEWALTPVETREFVSAQGLPAGIPRTHFEKKYLARGETCFEVTGRKARAP